MNKLKNILKFFLGNRLCLKLSKGNRFIFVFHDVSNKDKRHHSAHYSTTPDRFKEQINLLSQLFEIVTLNQIVTDKDLSKRKNYAAITFDDGFYSVLQNAAPFLKAKGVPFAVFINGVAVIENQLWVSNLQILKNQKEYADRLLRDAKASTMEDTDPVSAIVASGKFNSKFEDSYKIKADEKVYLDRQDVQQLQSENVIIGSHSYDHYVLASCDQQTLTNQVEKNNKLIEEITKNKAAHFAIPFGKKEHFNRQTLSAIKAAGHTFIYTTNPNRFGKEEMNNSDFLFPRIGIGNESERQLLFYINRALLRNYDL